MKAFFSAIVLFVVSISASVAAGDQTIRVLFSDPDGKPMPKADIHEFLCRDLTDEPIVADIVVTDGAASVPVQAKPVQFTALFSVPGFGEVTVYADGKGKGYILAGEYDFAVEAAATRFKRVEASVKHAEAGGVALPQTFYDGLAKARKARPYDSLALTLRLGEELTMARAKHRIAKLAAPRKGFLIGCNAMGHPSRGPLYDQRFIELFNYGTPNLYISHYAPTQDTRDYARTDVEIEWLLSNGLKAKTCPPFYLASGVVPQWLKEKKWPEVGEICRTLVSEACKRYAGRSLFCEITNEATMSNGLALSSAELVALTDIASKAAREGDPKVGRIINSAHLWGDYAAKLDKKGRPRLSPYAYLRECIKANIEFEIVGLQMYYPEYDLFEIDRMLDRYASLGKRIHVTEMGCASAPGIDPNAQRKKAAAGWHGAWSEEMQAEWVESVYTLFYSKPYIDAVSWWDLADAVSFWPYGGFLRGDLSPKPSYLRLQALKKEWGLTAPAVTSE